MTEERRRETDRIRHFLIKEIAVPLVVGALSGVLAISVAYGKFQQKMTYLDGMPDRMTKAESQIAEMQTDVHQILTIMLEANGKTTQR